MISKEEAKAGLRKAGYRVVEDNSVITVLIKETDQMKKTVSAVRELLLKMNYHASFSVRQEAFLDDDDDDLENAFEDVVIDESDMDMLLNEDSVQMSLEDLGLQM